MVLGEDGTDRNPLSENLPATAVSRKVKGAKAEEWRTKETTEELEAVTV